MKTFQQMSEQCILFLFSTTLGIGSSFSHHLGSGKEQQDIDLTSRFRKWCGSSMKSQLINSTVLLFFNNCRIESCAFTNFFSFYLIFFSAKQNGIPAVIEILWLMMAWNFFGRHIFNEICARMKSHLKPFKIHKALLF